MTKSFSTESIKQINLKLDNVYSVIVNSHEKPQVKIEVKVEGEHSEHIMLTSKRLFGSLLISCEQQPAFKDANDKLSAHKVLAIELSITVPQNIATYVKSDIAELALNGDYKNVIIELVEGNFTAVNFTGNLKVNTQTGHINLNTNYARIDAASADGKVDVSEITSGENTIALKSVKGNIKVTKSQE